MITGYRFGEGAWECMERRFSVKYFCIYGLYRVGVMYKKKRVQRVQRVQRVWWRLSPQFKAA